LGPDPEPFDVSVADAWDPNATPSAAWARGAAHIIMAQSRGITYDEKVEALMARVLPEDPTAMMVVGFLAAYYHAGIPSYGAQQGRMLTLLEKLRATSDIPGQGAGDMVWDGFHQVWKTNGFVWVLAGFADEDDPRWVALWEWFGRQYYLEYVPWHWKVTAGPSGWSWPTATYLDSTVDWYLFQLHFAMTKITGLDHFRQPELGGFYWGLAAGLAYRRLPSGQDCGFELQSTNRHGPSYRNATAGLTHFAALAYETKDPWMLDACARDKLGSALPESGPWCSPPTLPRGPVPPRGMVYFSGQFGSIRTGWGENDSVLMWRRGTHHVGHHKLMGPGHFLLYGKGSAEGAGGILIGNPWHYGWHGWQAEVIHRRMDRYNGALFFAPPGEDTSANDSYQFYTGGEAAGLKTLPFEVDGGPNGLGNPYDYRPSQTVPDVADVWESYQRQKSSIHVCREIGRGEDLFAGFWAWEALDWAPSFTRHPRGPGELDFRQNVNRRPTRVERWVRIIAMVDGVVLVYDDIRPLDGVRVVWQLFTSAELLPVPGDPTLYQASRSQDFVSAVADYKWPHVAAPAAHRSADKTTYRIRGHLHVRRLLGTSGLQTFAGGPADPYQGVTGTRLWPYGAKSGPLHSDLGPDEMATWRMRYDLGLGPKVLLHAFSTGISETPISGMTVVNGQVILVVGARTVTIDQTTYQVEVA
jgi:hypothetical protein